MISEERSTHVNKQALNFPVGLLLRSPKKRLAKLGRKPSNGSVKSSNSDSTVRSTESAGVRQPAKSKIRRHNNRLSTVFNHSPNLREGGRRGGQAADGGTLAGDSDDPAELSSQMSVPGILKIFGSDICQGTNYKSVLATTQSNAKELVKEALERYCLEKEDAGDYVLCDVIGQTGGDTQWKRECFRVVGDGERPLMLQSLWKPKEGFSRRFEIQLRASVEAQSLKDRDTVTAGINAQARKLQKSRSRVTSLFVDGSGEDADSLGFWRSLSEMDLSAMGREAGRARQSALREDPEAEADKEVLRLGMEKEETESSDDNATQYSIHPPFDFPYFLLLQGYSHRQDFVIYLMSGTTTIFGCCREHCNGEDEERLKVDILLFAPDVLPQHCCVRRLDSSHQTSAGGERRKTLTMLKPLHGAPVTRNGFLLKDEVELNPGDLVGLGKHYLFMFKDPTGASPHAPPWMTRLCPSSDSKATSSPCSSCGSSVAMETLRGRPSPPRWRDLEGVEASLSYEPEQEERVLQEILHTVDPGGDEHKLTPAFLLSLCIRHSASAFELTRFRQLLLRIAGQIQLVMWEKTKELAAIQPETSSGDEAPEHLQLLSMAELIPGLQPLVLWMANSIELLHFIQHEVPQLLPWRQDREDEGLLDSEMSSTRIACEEAMTVLEEVIMFTFQQSVYYLTKSMYSALPGLLDGNPFSESGQLRVPDGLGGILEVLKEVLKLLTAFQVHPDISMQLCAYLFFFINASLFNALMERGSVAGFFQWSRGVQIRANLDLLMDWIQSIGLGDLAAEFFQKLSAAVNLLATPKETLLQASWASLRTEFAALKPAQLHHMLREYSSVKACQAGWTPPPEDEEDVFRTADILESFDDHPPLILPSSTFHLELDKPTVEPSLFEQLVRLQEFVGRLPRGETPAEPDADEQALSGTPADGQSATSASVGLVRDPARQAVSDPAESDPDRASPAEPDQARGGHGDLSSCEAVLTQKLKSLELQNALPGQADMGYHKSLALDPSCLLTPPNTPQGMELSELEADLQEGARQLKKAGGNAEKKKTGNVEAEEEREEVFTVELRRGPHGLGLALVDGTKTALRLSGIYVKSVVPDSPAARCQKLKTGDRILAVNGISLVGMDYNTGRELIRSLGDSLKLLVATIDSKASAKAKS
ncbi:LOW QUALITY PROTEIN: ras-associating and dilute domain-containing protein-like [Embiotoca jacksoni]|uniref:LOW QUALITY PROTEIN: ras-associating and dilute domain-containing protein-like n=1 Tax=Embiotoca jacksoni TaxID=100190 RepID=UPI0037038729